MSFERAAKKSNLAVVFRVIAGLLTATSLGGCVIQSTIGGTLAAFAADPVDALTTVNGPLVGESPYKLVCSDFEYQTVGVEDARSGNYFFVRFAQGTPYKASFYGSVDEPDVTNGFIGIYDRDDITLESPGDFNGTIFTGLVSQDPHTNLHTLSGFTSIPTPSKMAEQASPAISEAAKIVFGSTFFTPHPHGFPISYSCEDVFGGNFFVPDGGYIITIDPNFALNYGSDYWGNGYGPGSWGGDNGRHHHHHGDDHGGGRPYPPGPRADLDYQPQ